MAVGDADGCIQNRRRKRDIITGGENIASLEIEAAMLAHPAVAQCVVVPAADTKLGEVPIGTGSKVSQEKLLAFAGSKLARVRAPASHAVRRLASVRVGPGEDQENGHRK
jgi:fatty-acyl-CoA synthase